MARKKSEKPTKYIMFPVRVDDSMYRQVKKMSYFNEIPMSEFVRRCIKDKLDQHKKL